MTVFSVFGLLITHKIGWIKSGWEEVLPFQNSNGIQSQSPGLRVPRYPGFVSVEGVHTPRRTKG
jgi:hypothetical protein